MPGEHSRKSLQWWDRIQNSQKGSDTSTGSSIRSRHKRPPVSVEAEHRLVFHTIHQCIGDIQGYRVLSEDVEVEDCAQTARDIMDYSREKSCDSVVDFMRFLQTKEYVLEEAIKERKSYANLTDFAQNVEKYAGSFPTVIDLMRSCITDHLSKYCVSFHDETTADDVIPTREYEDKIRDYKQYLEEKMKALEDKFERFEVLSTPFIEKCVLNVGEITILIDGSCTDVKLMWDIVKKWLLHDKTYPKKLGDDINQGNERKVKMRTQLTLISKKTEALHPTKRKHGKERARLVDKLNDQRRERRRVINSKETVDDLVEKSENELEQVKSDTEKTEQRITQRKSNSPKYLDSLWANQDRLKAEETKITHRLESFKRQLSRMDQDIALLDGAINKLEGEMAEEGYAIKELNDRTELFVKEFDQVEIKLRDQEEQIQKAKKIRNMKLDPLSVRKIFYQRLEPAESDQLSSACRHVSDHIGAAWRGLYNNLIFSPTRDRNRKQNDIDAVYTSCLRRDQTMSEQAWQSLVKWRVFNRQRRVENNLRGLAKALRKVEKFKLAQQIEQNYLKSSST